METAFRAFEAIRRQFRDAISSRGAIQVPPTAKTDGMDSQLLSVSWDTPPVGLNRTPELLNGPAMLFSIAVPPEATAGKNLTNLHPAPSAASTLEGVIAPGMNGSDAVRDLSITWASNPGDSAKHAPESADSSTCSMVRTVPTPTKTSGRSFAITRSASPAAAVRSVISTTGRPPPSKRQPNPTRRMRRRFRQPAPPLFPQCGRKRPYSNVFQDEVRTITCADRNRQYSFSTYRHPQTSAIARRLLLLLKDQSIQHSRTQATIQEYYRLRFLSAQKLIFHSGTKETAAHKRGGLAVEGSEADPRSAPIAPLRSCRKPGRFASSPQNKRPCCMPRRQEETNVPRFPSLTNRRSWGRRAFRRIWHSPQ